MAQDVGPGNQGTAADHLVYLQCVHSLASNLHLEVSPTLTRHPSVDHSSEVSAQVQFRIAIQGFKWIDNNVIFSSRGNSRAECIIIRSEILNVKL
jgi:hypothetical protein